MTCPEFCPFQEIFHGYYKEKGVLSFLTKHEIKCGAKIRLFQENASLKNHFLQYSENWFHKMMWGFVHDLHNKRTSIIEEITPLNNVKSPGRTHDQLLNKFLTR